jgi:serine/threonine-protein kinase
MLADGDTVTVGFARLRYQEAGKPAGESAVRDAPFVLCIQCGKKIPVEEADAGQALKVGSVFYCPKCAERLKEPGTTEGGSELRDETLVAEESFIGGDRVGNYNLIQRVGYGFGGFYWLAEDRRSGQKLVAKIYDPAAFEDAEWAHQWMREIRRTSRFVYESIVRVFNAGRYDERFVVAMEFIRGASLREVFNAHNRVTPKAALRIAADLLRALVYLAGQDYVHGDIQPAAVMVTRAGAAKLSDFGLRMTLPAFGPGARYKASRGIEYLRYYAPEQFDAQATLDARADVYGVAAVLYQLLCNRPPFGQTAAKELVTSIRQEMPIPPGMISADLPTALNSILARAMSKRPEERYESAADFLSDIEELSAAE